MVVLPLFKYAFNVCSLHPQFSGVIVVTVGSIPEMLEVSFIVHSTQYSFPSASSLLQAAANNKIDKGRKISVRFLFIIRIRFDLTVIR